MSKPHRTARIGPALVYRMHLVASLALVLCIVPVAAAAHAFLADSSPEVGERVAALPRTLELRFTESVVPQSVQLSIKTPTGAPIDLKRRTFTDGDTTVRAELPSLGRGIYLIDWRVISGGDGHLSGGEFAFAFGAGGIMPGPQSEDTSVSWPQTIARFLVILGVALAAGILLVTLLLSNSSGGDRRIRGSTAHLLRIMLSLAFVATVTEFVLFAQGLRPSGTSLSLDALAAALRSFVGFSDAISALIILYTLLASILSRYPIATFVALPLALVATAFQTHPAATSVLWKELVVSVHVLVAIFWAGALVYLACQVFIQPTELRREELLRALRRYSWLAPWTVGIILATGILAAVAVIPNATQLVASSYGRILLVKSGLIVIALICALFGRRILGALDGVAALDKLRTVMPVEGIFVVAVLAAAALLGNSAPPVGASATGRAGALFGVLRPKGPTQIAAARAGWLEAYLTASKSDLTLNITGPGDVPPDDLRLSTKDARGDAIFLTPPGKLVGGSAIGLAPRSCGLGCFTVPYRWRVGETRVRLKLESKQWEGGSASFTVLWPPAPEDRTIVGRMFTAIRAQKLVRIDDITASAPGAHASGIYQLSGTKIVSSLPYSQFVPNVRPFPKAGDGFVLYLPASHLWVRVWLDEAFRARRQLVISPGLEVDDRFSYAR